MSCQGCKTSAKGSSSNFMKIFNAFWPPMAPFPPSLPAIGAVYTRGVLFSLLGAQGLSNIEISVYEGRAGKVSSLTLSKAQLESLFFPSSTRNADDYIFLIAGLIMQLSDQITVGDAKERAEELWDQMKSSPWNTITLRYYHLDGGIVTGASMDEYVYSEEEEEEENNQYSSSGSNSTTENTTGSAGASSNPGDELSDSNSSTGSGKKSWCQAFPNSSYCHSKEEEEESTGGDIWNDPCRWGSPFCNLINQMLFVYKDYVDTEKYVRSYNVSVYF